MAQMRQGQGQHAAAVKIITKALAAARQDQKLDLLFIRAICNHALGYHKVSCGGRGPGGCSVCQVHVQQAD